MEYSWISLHPHSVAAYKDSLRVVDILNCNLAAAGIDDLIAAAHPALAVLDEDAAALALAQGAATGQGQLAWRIAAHLADVA